MYDIYFSDYRFHACLLRRDFDKNRDITDFRKAKELLDAGERELWLNQHYLPKKYVLFFASYVRCRYGTSDTPNYEEVRHALSNQNSGAGSP